MRFLRFALLSLAVFTAALLRAQTVRWESGDSALGNAVALVFEDCEPDGDPQLPTVPNATLALAGRSTSVNIVNTSVTRTLTLSYMVQARRGGPLQIPAFSVKTNKGQVRVAAFNGAAPSVTPESVATSKLTPERTTVWAGEVFELTYRLAAPRRNNPQFAQPLSFEWSPGPLIAEEWSKYSLNETAIDGQRTIVASASTRAYAKTPNTVRLEAAHQVVHVQTGAVGFGFFSQARMEPISITSDQPTLEVRPLPAAPASFAGAVGQFKLTSNVVPKEAAVGEPVTWTLELSGTGNWPDVAGLPPRDVSKDFQVVQPKAKRTPAEGKLFDMTVSEDVVLVPTKPGNYSVGPIEFTFFNPRTGSYETARTERTTVRITAAAATPPGANGSGATQSATTSSGSDASRASSPPAVAPSQPAGIPRDPILGTVNAALPLSTKALVLWLLAPICGLVVFWLVLAGRRAAKTDPLLPQRQARARLAGLLAEMRRGGTVSDGKLLQWQHDTAVLFGLRHAAPSALALTTRASARGESSTSLNLARTDEAAEWVTLWRETDRALYGANTTLPSDWTARAEAALAGKRVPGFNPMRLFLPQNLLAFAAALFLLLAVSIHPLHAAPPEVTYRAGDFQGAEKVWRQSVADRPTDWIARHNLSLALAQQDRPGEAAAHAVAAFVEHPNHAAVRWNLGLTTDKAGFVPAALVPFLKEGPASSIAALGSPAQWQRILIVASFVVAGALGWMLFNAYGGRSRTQAWAATALCAMAVLTGVVAIFGVVAYGEIGDARAVVTWQAGTLRSIPTEADMTQKMTALPAGSIAIEDKTFLGWTHLAFANGQTGWVRKEELVPLWR